MRPLIGLTSGSGELVQDWPMLYTNKDICDRVIKAGGSPIIIPLHHDAAVINTLMDHLDGVILTGEILSTKRNVMHDSESNLLRMSNPLRYDYEALVIEAAIRKELPLLGICRGFQVLNVECGGSVSDYDINIHNSVIHQQAGKVLPRETIHELLIEPDSKLREAVGTDKIMVNSFHRQGVLCVADGFKACAFSPDGNVEAIESVLHPFQIGVQYHPEMLVGDPHNKLFEAFVKVITN
jgi:putative glutamine amidotransferase